MVLRRATCSCERLTITVAGEPVRVSVCHCLACQKRTGSSFGAQARFRSDQVVAETGDGRTWTRTGDEGKRATFRFCDTCGATISYRLEDQPDVVAIPIGAFADPTFPGPNYSVYEVRKHRWVTVDSDEHYD